jgi:hypothetical protein
VDTFLADYRAFVEQRLRDQIARHRSIDPGASTERIKSIQYAHEVEVIDRIVSDPEMRDALKLLVKDWYRKL